jgi:hypothetical protein
MQHRSYPTRPGTPTPPAVPSFALHLVHGWWIASCPDCGHELGRSRDRRPPSGQGSGAAARSADPGGPTARPGSPSCWLGSVPTASTTRRGVLMATPPTASAARAAELSPSTVRCGYWPPSASPSSPRSPASCWPSPPSPTSSASRPSAPSPSRPPPSPRAGLVGAAAGRQLHHRGQPGHPLAESARRCLAGPLVRLDPGRLRHRRERGPERRPRPRAAGRPAVRRPAPGRAAGGVGAADERGPHRPPAPKPHPTRDPASPRRLWRRPRPHPSGNGHWHPAALAPAALQDRTSAADPDPAAAPDARYQVRELVARERSGAPP